jgi:hypothetical protein
MMNTEVSPRELPTPSESSPETSPLAQSYTDHPTAESEVAQSGAANTPERLFWSEPVTGPDGQAPEVGPNQMKLVEVQGPVSVRLRDGDVRDGVDGMTVPSGSVVSTEDGASAAVFIGGVDSARLMPDTSASFSQYLAGSVRHTTIKMTRGAIFSRVGRRAGETQKFEVETPEGVTQAVGTEFLDGLQNGHHYIFVQKGTIDLFVNGQLVDSISGHGGSSIGMGAYPSTTGLDAILIALLTELQPFNLKTNEVVIRVNQGIATPGELAYLAAAIAGALNSGDHGRGPGFGAYVTAEVGSAIIVSLHDLLPFLTSNMTPH